MVIININFTNNPNSVYYSGQNVSGEIKIHNEKTREIRCISLKIEGFAKVIESRIIKLSEPISIMDFITHSVSGLNSIALELARQQLCSRDMKIIC